jgi:glycosyltransferase involved in cell wall biosynthesis
MKICPNGVDVNQFMPSKNFSRNNDRPVILWAGSLDSHKRPSWAIDVLSHLRASNRNVSLKIIGDGYMKKQLENEVAKNKLCSSVIFLGHRNHEEMPILMANADVFIMTSKGEGMSNVLLEAMASGIAVVSTSASAKGVITNGIDGFKANTVEEMSSAVSQLLSNTLLRQSIGQQARMTVLEKYSLDRMLQDYVQLYRKIITKKLHSNLPQNCSC